jgi:hypothetical protein
VVNNGGGKDIKATGLNEIAQGITLTLSELKGIGIDSAAGFGRGFSNLELSGLELGHDGLTSAFKSFCERWEWGVRALVGEGNHFAQAVGLSAGTLYETDQYVEGTLKIGANSLMGNPNASEDEITRMSWGELAQNNALAHADYSKESFDRALQNSEQGWMGLNPENLHGAFGVSDSEYNQVLDDTFGPSPEERAQAAAQQQAQQGGSGG